MLDSVSPEVLTKVAEFGDSYIAYLYFKMLIPIPILITVLGIGYVVFRVVKREAKLIQEEN